jgi:S1-C subfamily serine protease
MKSIANIGPLFSTVALLLFTQGVARGQAPQVSETPSAEAVIARVEPSVAVILTGAGAGRLTGVASGVIVRSDGMLLTAYHVIKDAQEVQVRLKSGETYDHVDLVAVDQRRDIAALHIPAMDLPAVSSAPLAQEQPGEPIYVVSNPDGLTWSASTGILSAVRPVGDVDPGRSGYSVLQFTAQVSPGSSGGVVVDSQGRALGIVVFSMEGQGLNFAVPLDTVYGLAEETTRTPLPSGGALELTPPARPPSSAALAQENPAGLLRSAHTIYVQTHTVWFTPETLEKELTKQKEFQDWGLVIVRDLRLADVDIEVDRPLWTYTFTVTVLDTKTSMLLGSDKVVAASGDLAAPGLAKKVVGIIAAARGQTTASKK